MEQINIIEYFKILKLNLHAKGIDIYTTRDWNVWDIYKDNLLRCSLHRGSKIWTLIASDSRSNVCIEVTKEVNKTINKINRLFPNNFRESSD